MICRYTMEVHMDLVILAGGRGRRLGALTIRKHKGALSFAGKPILVRILDQWLKLSAINTIWIVTGYRHRDIEKALNNLYSHELTRRKIVCVRGATAVVGTLSRLRYVLKSVAGTQGVIVTGVDDIFAEVDVARFVANVSRTQASVLLAVSKELLIAPTHPAARLQGTRVIEYRTGAEQRLHGLTGRWHRDTGLRYFSDAACARMIRDIDIAYIGEFISANVPTGISVRAFVLRRTWVHIAVARNFTQQVP